MAVAQPAQVTPAIVKPETPTQELEYAVIGTRPIRPDGDVAQGFREADVVVGREYRTAPVHQGYIEPHCAASAKCRSSRRWRQSPHVAS